MPEVTHHTVCGAPRLDLRRRAQAGPPVLYIHGSTFPCALAVGYRFADGRSWEDDLHAQGFDVWGLDFEGYGGSDRPQAFAIRPDASPPSLRSADAVAQIARAAAFIRAARNDSAKLALIAHSWGTIPAARYTTEHIDQVARLVLFGPILLRDGEGVAALPPAWLLINVAQQLQRFNSDVPAGAARVLAEPTLAAWGPAYLATDPAAHTRTPPAVQIPGGPIADLQAIWSGTPLYDPAKLLLPTLVVRGAWDSVCTDEDVARFFASRARGGGGDIVIPRATHLLHLETGRFALWQTTANFLRETL